ncbi:hypothetical protein ACHRVK_12130 [Flavobacterium plurextorum]|uniref:hypothetical protein n=1 Tax=Flavobacterium TaxID=237 RepID=UPI000C1918B9|nr:hypothetical protein [Flavobacterium sp. 2]PIF59938.1 hypothetical protein CLU99_3175 [Flavobacterium sp. 2]
MNTLELKNILISEIEKIDDDTFLSALKTILDSRKTSLPTDYSERYNEDLKVAEEDIRNGNFYSHDDVKDKIEQWKKK